MNTFDYEITVNRPIDVVFKNLACLKGCINWTAPLRSSEKLDEGPIRLGSTYRLTSGFMGMSTEAILEVKVFNPPYEYATADHASSKSMLPVEIHYRLAEVPGGTRIHNHVELKTRDNFIGRIAASILLPRLRKQIEQDLDTFRDLVESGVTVHA